MNAEQVPAHRPGHQNWQEPSNQLRNPWRNWQQSLNFPIRLPLVLWWAVLLGTVAFGSFLNVYMSARISDARLQLARFEEDLTRQGEINSELLFRIGQEVDLKHISIWAQNQGFRYLNEMLWLDQEAKPLSPVTNPDLGAQDPSAELLSPASRFQGALDTLGGLSMDMKTGMSRFWLQISGFSPLPPETRRPNNRIETEEEGFLGDLWKSVLEAINVSNS